MTSNFFKLIFVVLVFAFCMFLFLTGSLSEQKVFGFEFKGTEVPIFHAVTAFFATVTGVIFSIIVSNSGNDLTRLGWKDFGSLLIKVTTPGALIIASLVYIFAFHSIYNMSGDWVAYFTAFQSGFFFKEVMTALIDGKRPKSQ